MAIMTLNVLLGSISACRDCAADFPHAPRPVVRVALGTKILICGQAPGRKVHESGLPFDDASGDRLRLWMGVDRSQFYGDDRIGVAGMAFCFPGTDPKGGDFPPPPRCAARWRTPLLSRLPHVQLTLLVGGYAQRWALGDQAALTVRGTVARWRDYLPRYLALPHPSWRNTAWLRNNPWFDQEVTPYLRLRTADILAQ